MNLARKPKSKLLQIIQQRLSSKKPNEGIPSELQAAIDSCKTVEELKDLLFSLDYKDEKTIQAFDKKLDELYSPF